MWRHSAACQASSASATALAPGPSAEPRPLAERPHRDGIDEAAVEVGAAGDALDAGHGRARRGAQHAVGEIVDVGRLLRGVDLRGEPRVRDVGAVQQVAAPSRRVGPPRARHGARDGPPRLDVRLQHADRRRVGQATEARAAEEVVHRRPVHRLLREHGATEQQPLGVHIAPVAGHAGAEGGDERLLLPRGGGERHRGAGGHPRELDRRDEIRQGRVRPERPERPAATTGEDDRHLAHELAANIRARHGQDRRRGRRCPLARTSTPTRPP